jgi:hypothetical protein
MSRLKRDNRVNDVHAFLDVHNDEMYRATLADLDRERENNRVLHASGWMGTTLSMGAAVLDLPTLIPGGALVRGAALGYKTLKSAASVGAGAAGAAFVAEAGLHATQLERDGTRTLYAVAGATALGALLGAAGAKFLSHTELRDFGRNLETELAHLGEDQAKQLSAQIVNNVQMAGAGGADAAITRTVQELTLAGIGPDRMAKVLGRLRASPSLRNLTSNSLKAREYTSQLVETSLQLNANRAGATLGTSAEAAVRVYRGDVQLMIRDLNEMYKQLRATGEKLTRSEFHTRISQALRRDDVDPLGNPVITSAAQRARKLLDDVYDRGEEVGAFNAKQHIRNYVHRIYDQTQLIRGEAQFRQMVREYLDGSLPAMRDGEGNIAKFWLTGAGKDFIDRQEYIQDVVDSIYMQLTGRGDKAEIPPWIIPIERGPLKERTLRIPDTYVSPSGIRFEDFLESDIAQVMTRYTRVAAGEIELRRRFGSATLKDQLKDIEVEYANLRNAAMGDAKALEKITKEERAVRENMEAMRDLVRGTYGRKALNTPVAGALTRSVLTFNYMTGLGGVALSSLGDLAAIPGKFGMKAVLMDLVPTLVTNMKALRLSIEDAKAGGTVWEWANNSRLLSMAEVAEHNIVASRAERGLQWMSSAFSKLTLLPIWNDTLKGVSGALSVNRLVNTALKFDTASKYDKGWFTQLGLSSGDARTIRQLVDAGVVTKDGNVWIANTDKWMDALGQGVRKIEADTAAKTAAEKLKFDALRTAENASSKYRRFKKGKKAGTLTVISAKKLEKALKGIEKAEKTALRQIEDAGHAALIIERRAVREKSLRFREALATDVDRTIITPGYADKPKLMYTSNVAKLMFQFKGFMMAANQRLLMAGLQGRPLWLGQHILLGTGIGMMVAYFKLAERKGFDEANKYLDNYGRWIAEGLDRSGTLTYLFEINNTISKTTKAPVIQDVASLIAGDKGNMEGQSQRFASRSTLGAVGGPTVGLMDDVVKVADQLMRWDVQKSGVNAALRQVPGVRLPYWRWAIENNLKPYIEEEFEK